MFQDVPPTVQCRMDLLGIRKKSYISSISFVANLLANAWHGKDGSVKDTNILIDSLKDLHVFLSIPLILETFEREGLYEIETLGGYKIICEILLMCLTESSIKFNLTVPLKILEISKKYFYCEQNVHSDLDNILGSMGDSNRRDLLDSLVKHKLWKDPNFWEASLVLKITELKKSPGVVTLSGQEVQEKIGDLVYSIAENLVQLK